MPLRKVQNLEQFGFGDIKYQIDEVNSDTGISRKVDVSQCERLPDADKTNLAKQIKAGVNLEQVNCDLLNPRGTIRLSSTDEFDDKQLDDKESDKKGE